MSWQYQGKTFTEDDIKDFVGFVYIITNLTNDRKYIGRKLFTKAKTTQVKGKKKKTRISSDWESYFGSNKTLLEEVATLGQENYKREILHLCKSLSACAYLETYEIFKNHALIGDDFYNEWVTCKISKRHLQKFQLT